MKYLYILFIIISFSAAAQNDGWMNYDNTENKSNNNDSSKITLDYNLPDGTVTAKTDPRVVTLIKFIGAPKSPDPVLMKGYRVQINFSQNKSTALQEKNRFTNTHDDVSSYMDYLAPNFRIRVGNYKTRLEAEKLEREIINEFPAATVVNDLIELPQIENCNASGRNTEKN